MRVDQGADVIEQLRSVLNFVEDDRRAQSFKEGAWVTANAILNNAALSPEARRRLLDAAARQNEPEPAAEVSRGTTLALLVWSGPY